MQDKLFGGGETAQAGQPSGAGTTTKETRSAEETVKERVEMAGPGTPSRGGPTAGPVCAPSKVRLHQPCPHATGLLRPEAALDLLTLGSDCPFRSSGQDLALGQFLAAGFWQQDSVMGFIVGGVMVLQHVMVLYCDFACGANERLTIAAPCQGMSEPETELPLALALLMPMPTCASPPSPTNLLRPPPSHAHVHAHTHTRPPLPLPLPCQKALHFANPS
jgi:hypothetical protein